MENAEEFKQLPSKVRENIKQRADALHKELEKDAKKLQEEKGQRFLLDLMVLFLNIISIEQSMSQKCSNIMFI